MNEAEANQVLSCRVEMLLLMTIEGIQITTISMVAALEIEDVRQKIGGKTQHLYYHARREV